MTSVVRRRYRRSHARSSAQAPFRLPVLVNRTEQFEDLVQGNAAQDLDAGEYRAGIEAAADKRCHIASRTETS